MFKVIETFSGIGAQAKALSNINANYEILNTVDWDIGAIIAYNSIHHTQIDYSKYKNLKEESVDAFLSDKSLSMDGKQPFSFLKLKKYPFELKKTIYISIKESKNLVDITKVKGCELPNDIDLLTYSFPCQDLSLCGAWTGGISGISREAHTRSGLLWEVERILFERFKNNRKLPSFLLMENVPSILSPRHLPDFNDWKKSLNTLGYFNQIYTLDARNFCKVQKRRRTYMISVLYGNEVRRHQIEQYFREHNLEDLEYVSTLNVRSSELPTILCTDYLNSNYLAEAMRCVPNDTPSRQAIYNENVHLVESGKEKKCFVECLTTKQDRNPNSGVIDLPKELWREGKSRWRYLTPRECFMLMGFSEEDFNNVIKNNPPSRYRRNILTNERLYKMAGNSIVVNVLEEIFKQILDIKQLYFNDDKKND